VTLDVQARDDRGVVAIEMDCFVDGGTTSVLSQHKDITAPAANVQTNFSVDLNALALSNATHVVRTNIVAIDNKNQRSDEAGPYVFEIHIQADTSAPLAGISKPIQSSTLYHGENIVISWRAVDESRLAQIDMRVGGASIYSRALSQASQSGQFNYVVPAEGDELLITLHVSDVFGNESSTNWRYSLISDVPTTISIRSPAQGSRLVEGEQFTLTASVTDNRKVVSAVFFMEQGSQTLFSKTFSEGDIAAAQEAG